MLRFYLCKGFNNLLEQDDKGDVSSETTGPAPAEVSAGIQISENILLRRISTDILFSAEMSFLLVSRSFKSELLQYNFLHLDPAAFGFCQG
ncbi:hypothetical protein V6N13_008147 [Hibiscus sabdariffa]